VSFRVRVYVLGLFRVRVYVMGSCYQTMLCRWQQHAGHRHQKKARKAQRQAERSAVPIPHAITKKQKRKANKAKSQSEQASQNSSGRGRAVEAGGVSKKKGGKFANKNKK